MNAYQPTIAERAVTFTPRSTTVVDPAAWVARAVRIRAVLAEHGVAIDDVGAAVRELVLVDPAGTRWRCDAAQWERQDGRRWTAATPVGPLQLLPYELDLPLAPDPDPEAGLPNR